MGIISRMRKQSAIYWPPGKPDSFGQVPVGTLVELVSAGSGNFRVRWEDQVEEIVLPDSSVVQSTARVYVPLLPDSSEVAVGGWLWLGVRGSLTSETAPASNPGAFEIKRVDKMPTIKASEFLRTAYL